MNGRIYIRYQPEISAWYSGWYQPGMRYYRERTKFSIAWYQVDIRRFHDHECELQFFMRTWYQLISRTPKAPSEDSRTGDQTLRECYTCQIFPSQEPKTPIFEFDHRSLVVCSLVVRLFFVACFTFLLFVSLAVPFWLFSFLQIISSAWTLLHGSSFRSSLRLVALVLLVLPFWVLFPSGCSFWFISSGASFLFFYLPFFFFTSGSCLWSSFQVLFYFRFCFFPSDFAFFLGAIFCFWVFLLFTGSFWFFFSLLIAPLWFLLNLMAVVPVWFFFLLAFLFSVLYPVSFSFSAVPFWLLFLLAGSSGSFISSFLPGCSFFLLFWLFFPLFWLFFPSSGSSFLQGLLFSGSFLLAAFFWFFDSASCYLFLRVTFLVHRPLTVYRFGSSTLFCFILVLFSWFFGIFLFPFCP